MRTMAVMDYVALANDLHRMRKEAGLSQEAMGGELSAMGHDSADSSRSSRPATSSM